MGDPYADLDDLIREVDKALNVLKKIKSAQVRNGEHRDFFRATALGWFKRRRPTVAQDMPPDVVEAIDTPYQTILNAAERHASKTTYVNAAKNAKQALVAARTHALVPQPIAHTADSAPSFSALASDPLMQGILQRRWEECSRCIEAGAPLAATVMMGGLLEALLVARANKLFDKSKLFKTKSAPMDPKTKKPLELRKWTLAAYIDVGHELNWISNSAKDVAVIVRDYRNYIHPEKERSHGMTLSSNDAALFWDVTKNLSRELLAMKGEV
ncbi:MAG: hypothetical protein ACFB13_23445 [Kiloniellaceae bacterium]